MEGKGSQSYWTVLAIKPFRILWINEILVQLSYNMVNFALIVRVFNLTGKNTASSLFVLAAAIPALLFGVFTGVLADIFDKKKILLFTDLAIGICFFLFLLVQSYVALILLVALLLNIAFQFFIPAEAATIPIIVKKNQLMTANALFYFVLTLCMIVGYSAAGPIVTHFGYAWIFIFAGSAMLVGFFLRGALPALPSDHPDKARYKKGETRMIIATSIRLAIEGLAAIRRNVRILVPTMVLVLVQLISSILVALGPGFMEEVLHVQAADASQILLFPLGMGLILGALITGRFGDYLPRRYAIVIGVLVAAIAILGFGSASMLFRSDEFMSFTQSGLVPFGSRLNVSIFVAICAVILGTATAMMVIPCQTILQHATSTTLRGRVFSIIEVLKAVVAVLPVLVVGTLADIFGIVPMMIAISVLLFICALIAWRFVAFEKHLPTTLRHLQIMDS